MQITELHLQTQDLKAQRVFYTTILGLPLSEETPRSFTIQAGTTRLTFQATLQQEELSYHFAFTIPGNKQTQAKDWLRARVPLLTQADQDEFFFQRWNAHSVYFLDAADNVLECIVHHDLANNTPGTFGVPDFLYVSEIGMVVDNVLEQIDAFQTKLGIEPYKVDSSDLFAALGDIYGLFITVKAGRVWFPTPTKAAVVAPVHVTIRGTREQHYRASPFPYDIDVVATPA